MFSVGQYVIHPRFGAGEIIDLAHILICDQKKTCYVINPLLEEIIIKIPVDTANTVGLRLPLPVDKIITLLEILKEPLLGDQQDFLRTAKIPQEINLTDPTNVLNIIKFLFYEKIYRQQEGKSLSLSKRRLYTLAISLIASEIVAIKQCSIEEACFTVRNSLVFQPTPSTSTSVYNI
ncbi:hypothetical protein KJ596_02345 [Patescibacteria group bacterium]|nr:hypothetical protein [Patescibacteria group bacterium]MBU1868631.1 hypothetical protein [Patescibacteria group bacterium]